MTEIRSIVILTGAGGAGRAVAGRPIIPILATKPNSAWAELVEAL